MSGREDIKAATDDVISSHNGGFCSNLREIKLFLDSHAGLEQIVNKTSLLKLFSVN